MSCLFRTGHLLQASLVGYGDSKPGVNLPIVKALSIDIDIEPEMRISNIARLRGTAESNTGLIVKMHTSTRHTEKRYVPIERKAQK